MQLFGNISLTGLKQLQFTWSFLEKSWASNMIIRLFNHHCIGLRCVLKIPRFDYKTKHLNIILLRYSGHVSQTGFRLSND